MIQYDCLDKLDDYSGFNRRGKSEHSLITMIKVMVVGNAHQLYREV